MPQHIQLNFPDAAETTQKSGFAHWPVWACGFRPFFLGGAIVAAISIALWLVVFFGGHSAGGAAGPIGWHAHEMIFGFTPAIIAGFLLTAVPKWTRVPTPTGPLLAALFGLWLAGRLAMMLAGIIPYGLAAAIDFIFLPGLAVAIAIPIIRAKTPRNLGFIPLLFGLAAANGLFHLSHLGLLDGWATRGLDAGLAIIIVIIAIVGGRVIPFFTTNKLGRPAIDRRRIIDIVAVGASVAWLFAFIIASASPFAGIAAIVAGAANLARMIRWHSLASVKVPLLWILHLGYAFVGIGLVALGFATLDITASRTIAIHALTTGAIGLLCLGMMSRVALGHTGRQLKAARITTAAFVILSMAAALRVFLPWLIPAAYSTSIMVSGILWTVAWGLFLVVYVPILVKPRVDGRPG